MAKEELLKGRRELLQQLKTIEEILANMEAVERRSGGSLEHLPPVRKDEFRGKRAVQALDAYLRARRGFKIPLSRIVEDLVEAGADPGDARGKVNDPKELIDHQLRIAVGNRRDLCDWEPKDLSARGREIVKKGASSEEVLLWLSETADIPKKRKRKD